MNSTSKEFELLVATRPKNKSKRKRKGRNTQGWEKLRERGVLGISTIEGGGLVSAPITGKALPRFGRRLFRRGVAFDPQPIDADKDKIVQEGTQFERPAAPSIPSAITPTVPKPYTPVENTTPYGGTRNLIKEQRKQTKQFEAWAKAGKWKKFHSSHFDWWTFPIDRGSMAYGYEFTPPKDELNKLRNNIPYLASLRKAASLYMLSMAWDMKNGDWIDNPDFDAGQEPIPNVNQARLFKIARSMQIHGLRDEFLSVRRMVQSLRDAGVKVGNEDYWDRPHSYQYKPLSPINTVMEQALPNPDVPKTGGITGRMGISFNPKSFSSVDGGPQRFDIDTEPAFRKRYDELDSSVEQEYMNFMAARAKSEGGSLKNPDETIRSMVADSVIESFYWKDDRTRLEHLRYLGEEARTMPSTNKKTGKRLRTYPVSVGERKKKRTGVGKEWNTIGPLFERLFGWVGGTKSGYPAIYDLSQALTQSSSTPKREDVATANLVQQMLGVVDKYLNPTNYTKAFEEWIRNPRIVAKDKNGKIVGIRLAFNNDRKEMMAEFDRRISYAKDELAKLFSVDRAQFDRELPPDIAARKYIDETPDLIRERIIETLRESMNDVDYKMATTMEQIANIINERLKEETGIDEKGRGFNGEALKQLLEKSENLSLLASMKRQKASLFDVSPFDDIPAKELSDAREFLDIYLLEAKMKNEEPSIDGAREWVDEKYFSDDLLSALIAERIANGS